MEKICVKCKKPYAAKTKWSKEKRENSKFCSVDCYRAGLTNEMRAKMADNARRNIAKETESQRKLRIKHTIEARLRNGIWEPHNKGKSGDEVSIWKGDKASYNSKHRWIQKHWHKTGVCEDCKVTTTPFGNRKYGTEWANLDGCYDRENRETWRELCVPCHRKLDRVN